MCRRYALQPADAHAGKPTPQEAPPAMGPCVSHPALLLPELGAGCWQSEREDALPGPDRGADARGEHTTVPTTTQAILPRMGHVSTLSNRKTILGILQIFLQLFLMQIRQQPVFRQGSVAMTGDISCPVLKVFCTTFPITLV